MHCTLWLLLLCLLVDEAPAQLLMRTSYSWPDPSPLIYYSGTSDGSGGYRLLGREFNTTVNPIALSMLHIDSSGAVLNSRVFHGAGVDWPLDAVLALDHGMFVPIFASGSLWSMYRFGDSDSMRWRCDLLPPVGHEMYKWGRLAEHPGQDCLLAATIYPTSYDSAAGLILSVSDTGQCTWSRRYDHADRKVEFHGIASLPSSGFLVSGILRNDADSAWRIVVRIDPLGNIVWARKYGQVDISAEQMLRPGPGNTWAIISGYVGASSMTLIDAQGDVQAAYRSNIYVREAAFTSNDELMVTTGSVYDNCDLLCVALDGTILWRQRLNGQPSGRLVRSGGSDHWAFLSGEHITGKHWLTTFTESGDFCSPFPEGSVILTTDTTTALPIMLSVSNAGVTGYPEGYVSADEPVTPQLECSNSGVDAIESSVPSSCRTVIDPDGSQRVLLLEPATLGQPLAIIEDAIGRTVWQGTIHIDPLVIGSAVSVPSLRPGIYFMHLAEGTGQRCPFWTSGP